MAWGGQSNSMRTGLARAMKPRAGAGSATTPGYKQSITAAFAKVPGAAGYSVPPPYAPAPSAPKFDMANLPVDPSYDAQIGGLGRTRSDTIAGLEGQKTGALADFGYSATYDAKGNVASLSFDPNNPFSRAALLRKHYGQAKAGTANSMAARGQGSSGALINAQNANDSSYLQNDNVLTKGLGGILAGLIGGQRTAGTDYETGAGVAYGDRITRAQNNPNYNPAPADAPPADTPPASPQIDLSKWVKTTSKNSAGHPVRTFGDGHREVFVNGQWKRV